MLAAPSAISRERRAERDAGGDRGQRVGQVVRLGEGEVEGLAPGRGRDQRLGDARRRPALSTRLDVAAGAEAQQARRAGQVRLELAGLGRDDRGARRRQRRQQLGLRRGDRLDRAEQLDVDRADVGDHGRRRARRSPPARRSGRRRASPSPAPATRSRGRFEDGQRQPDLGVEVLAVGVDAARQQRPGDVLDRGLADRAGDPDHPRAERPPPGSGQRLQRRQRVLDREHPSRPPQRPADRARRADDRAPGAGLERRRRRTRRRRRCSPRRPKKRSPSPAAAGVDRRPRRRRRRPALASDLGPDRGGDLLRARGFTPALPSLRSSSRATSRSSKGILRPSSNSWPCSWPLPAITTVSPGSARARASAIAARRSGSTSTPLAALGPGEDFGDDRLRVLGARVVGGDDRQVGALGPGPAHLRPLVAVAVAAGAEDRDQPPAVSRRAARSTFSSESGVCA